jgi:anti-sigma factor RsiW
MKALSTRYASDRAALVAALDPVLREPVPPRLAKAIEGEARSRRSWQALLRSVAAAVLLLVAGGAAGYLAAASGWLGGEQAGEQFADNAIGAFLTYAVDQAHAVEVDGSDKAYLEAWLSKRVGTRVVAPDLAAEGFTLLGGRILPAGHRPAALLVYEDKAGYQLSIYVTGPSETEARGTYAAQEDGPTAIYWLNAQIGCAIVGDMPDARLTEVARIAWRQMKEAMMV